MDGAAAAPQAWVPLARQLSRQSSLDDAEFNLVDLPVELLALKILYRLPLAHDIAQLAPLCSALRDAARLCGTQVMARAPPDNTLASRAQRESRPEQKSSVAE